MKMPVPAFTLLRHEACICMHLQSNGLLKVPMLIYRSESMGSTPSVRGPQPRCLGIVCYRFRTDVHTDIPG